MSTAVVSVHEETTVQEAAEMAEQYGENYVTRGPGAEPERFEGTRDNAPSRVAMAYTGEPPTEIGRGVFYRMSAAAWTPPTLTEDEQLDAAWDELTAIDLPPVLAHVPAAMRREVMRALRETRPTSLSFHGADGRTWTVPLLGDDDDDERG